MKGTMVVFHPPGTKGKRVEVRHLEGPPTLEWLQAGIGGGYLQLIPFFNRYSYEGKRRPCVAFCDEEGKIKGQPYNSIATAAWREAIGRHAPLNDICVGQICVVFGDNDFMEQL